MVSEKVDIIKEIVSLSSQDKQEIIDNIKLLLLNFPKLPKKLQDQLLTCKSQKMIDLVQQQCTDQKKSCKLANPFLMISKCAPDQNLNDQFECVTSCPIEMGEIHKNYCKKATTVIQKVEFDEFGMPQNDKCPTYYKRSGHLCIGQCPRGFREFGNWCERPLRKVEFKEFLLEF